MNRHIRTSTLVLLIGSLASAPDLLADDSSTTSDIYYGYGEVVKAEPIIRRHVEIAPQKECKQVRQPRRRSKNHRQGQFLPSLLGGLVGGVIGHQFGGGRGKTVLTIAGAVAGANIAKGSSSRHDRDESHDRNGRRHKLHRGYETRCEIVDQAYEVEKVDGYRVTYRYLGREFTRTTEQHPGSRIQLRVQVEPVEETLISSLAGNDSSEPG